MTKDFRKQGMPSMLETRLYTELSAIRGLGSLKALIQQGLLLHWDDETIFHPGNDL